MTRIKMIQFSKPFRKICISALMITIVALSFASKGGGGDKRNSLNNKSEFTPIRTTNGFTLKTGPAYSGSHILSQDKSATSLQLNTVVTFQKGNTTYILPYKYVL